MKIFKYNEYLGMNIVQYIIFMIGCFAIGKFLGKLFIELLFWN